MLHVHNGDSAASLLRQSGAPGTSVVWCDVLHDGPTPAHLSPREWRCVRARFHCECGFGSFTSCLRRLRHMDAALTDLAAHDEVVLWFEADLFDQLLLIRLLSLISKRPRPACLSLVSLDSHPDVPRFVGFGQLSPSQMAGLLPTRQDVTPAQIELATRAWNAFCWPDPLAVQAIMDGDTSALPFLNDALHRHLEEFPGANGLSRTQRQVVQFLDTASRTCRDLFHLSQDAEARPFLGDTLFWMELQRLASGPRPLLEPSAGTAFSCPDGLSAPDAAFLNRELRLTPAGRDTLHGEDWTKWQPLDRWKGAAHLQGRGAWHWDGQRLQNSG